MRDFRSETMGEWPAGMEMEDIDYGWVGGIVDLARKCQWYVTSSY